MSLRPGGGEAIMPIDAALSAATALLRAQLSRFGLLSPLLGEYGLLSDEEQHDHLNKSRDRSARRVLGLSLARTTLENAIALSSFNLLDRFLFRLGAYLTEVSQDYLPAEQQAARRAAQYTLRALRNPPSQRLANLDAGQLRRPRRANTRRLPRSGRVLPRLSDRHCR